MFLRKNSKLFYNPIVIFMGIQILSPRPGTRFDFLLELCLISFYSLIYLTLTENGLLLSNIKTNFLESYTKFKVEINLLFFLFIYELFLLVFMQPNSISNLSFTVRPLYLLVILIFGYSIKNLDDNLIESTLSFIYIALLINFIVAILQFYDINILTYIYNDPKAFPKGKLVRLTGLYPNPNEFAWQIAQYMLFILIFEYRKNRVVLSLITSIIFVLLSGSRSILVIMPIMLIFPIIFKNIFVNKNLKVIFKTILYTVFGFVLIIFILIKFKHKLPYISQLLQVFDGGLSNVNSFDLRLKAWRRVIDVLSDNFSTFMFGTRNYSYGSIDNDFLYILNRSGFIGFLSQQLIQIYMMAKLLMEKPYTKIKIYTLTLFIFSIIVGLQADTLSGWLFFPYIILFYSLSFVCERSE